MNKRRSKYKNDKLRRSHLNSYNNSLGTKIDSILKITNIFFYVLISVVGLYLANKIHKNEQELQNKIEANKITTTLVESIINGPENKRLLCMSLLESINDSLAFQIYRVLALEDKSASVRTKALEFLGQSGMSAASEILEQAKEKAPTEEEKDIIVQAKETFNNVQSEKFRTNLQTARNFYELRRWDISAQYFRKALKYIDKDSIDNSTLLIANNYFNKKFFEQAAEYYYKLFSKY